MAPERVVVVGRIRPDRRPDLSQVRRALRAVAPARTPRRQARAAPRAPDDRDDREQAITERKGVPSRYVAARFRGTNPYSTYPAKNAKRGKMDRAKDAKAKRRKHSSWGARRCRTRPTRTSFARHFVVATASICT